MTHVWPTSEPISTLGIKRSRQKELSSSQQQRRLFKKLIAHSELTGTQVVAFVSSAPDSFITFCWPPNEMFRHYCNSVAVKIPFSPHLPTCRNVFVRGYNDIVASIFFFASDRLLQQFHDVCMPKDELFALAQKMYRPFSPSAFSLHVEQFISHLNKDKTMCAAGLYGGSYVNGRYVVDGEVKRGITKRLKQKFYANYAASDQRRSRSSKLLGVKVHRQLYHKYTCKKSCQCVAMFGSKTRRAKNKFVRAFELFLIEKRLQVVGCEVVISDGDFATGIDVLCVDAAGLHCPVEVKCGDWPHLQTARTVDGTKLMTTLAVPNSHANQHQLQLWFNVHCLRKRGVLVGSCYVVYLQANGRFRAYPGATWWSGERGKVVEEIFHKD